MGPQFSDARVFERRAGWRWAQAGKQPGAGGNSWPPQLPCSVTRHWPVLFLLNFSFHSLQPFFAPCLFVLTSGLFLLPAHPPRELEPLRGCSLHSGHWAGQWQGASVGDETAGLPLTWHLSSVGECKCDLARVFPWGEHVTQQDWVFGVVSAWLNDWCYYWYHFEQNSWLGSVWAGRAASAAISGQERWLFAIVTQVNIVSY